MLPYLLSYILIGLQSDLFTLMCPIYCPTLSSRTWDRSFHSYMCHIYCPTFSSRTWDRSFHAYMSHASNCVLSMLFHMDILRLYQQHISQFLSYDLSFFSYLQFPHSTTKLYFHNLKNNIVCFFRNFHFKGNFSSGPVLQPIINSRLWKCWQLL